MVDPIQGLAEAVRARAPLVHCFACLPAQLGLTEKVLRDAAQVLVIREPFLVRRRTCSLCLKVEDILVVKAVPYTVGE
jgi:hypothetical protein